VTGAVAQVVYSARSLDHLERAFQFLREKNPTAGLECSDRDKSAVDSLGAHPFIGRRIEGEIRELVVSYGHSGYVALYRFVASQNEVRVLAIRHRRELGFQP
jgi:plasmid stabilization system protein ParE